MTDRTYTIAGFSTLGKIRKVRFANGTIEAREKILKRKDHTDIDLRLLPNPMTKADAMVFLGVAEDDPRAPKGVQAAAAKAKSAAKVTKVIEIVKEATKAEAASANEEAIA